MADRFFIGRCEFDLHIENCRSLKDKRRVVSSLKEKLRNRYNVSVCEYGDLSLWQRTQLGVVMCGNDQTDLDSRMKALLSYLNKIHSVSLLDYSFQII
ncbi:MAG: DUF503 domain-containing protein [candidate division WOR-3 bacterium]|nr:MAG: DUF503 domain-containing protein [candidate division WOR-3 bacterium]